jgi:hypothetical protein
MHASLSVIAAGYSPVLLVAKPGAATAGDALTLELEPCASAELHVRDANDEPLEGATISVSARVELLALPDRPMQSVTAGRTLRASLEDPEWQAVTDSEGIARFEALPAGTELQAFVATRAGEHWKRFKPFRLSSGSRATIPCGPED